MTTLSHHRGVVRRARQDEQGSVLILVALCSLVLVVSVAFTVDLGRISTTRRDLQKGADAVALDLSRRLDGRPAGQIRTEHDFDLAYENSTTRNGIDPTDGSWDVGRWDATTETWTPSTDTEVPSAVRVDLGTHVDFEFVPGGADTSRMAVAARKASADLCLGSFATRLDTGDAPLLGALLNGALGANVDLVSYQGVVGGSVGIEALATELGTTLGTPDEFLDTEITIVQFIEAQAQVLEMSGDLTRASLLRDLAVVIADPDRIVRLGDLLNVGTGGHDAALDASLDAFDLLSTAILAANGDNFISIPNLNLAIPGVADVDVALSVVEQPKCLIAGAVGDQAQSAVVRLKISNDLGVLSLVRTSLDLELDAAAATATISGLDCASPKQLRLDVTTAAVQTTIRFDLVVLGSINVPVTGATNQAPLDRYFDLEFPDAEFGQTYQVPTPGLDLGQMNLTIGGDLAVVGAIVSPLITAVLRPVLTAVDNLLLTPLLSALGITVAGADVTPRALHCSGPRLVG